MAFADQLTPPEQFLLLNPQGASPSELIKIGLFALIAGGIVKVTEGPPKGILSRRPTSLFDLVAGRSRDAPRALMPLVEVMRNVGEGSTDIVAAEARKAFGNKLLKFREQLQDGLVKRGVLTREIKPVMFVFARTVHELTPAGTTARDEIKRKIESAWRLPNLLHSDPQEAALIMAAAGTSLLLVQELRPHYRRMGEISKQYHVETSDSGSWTNTSADSTSLFDASAFPSFDASSLSSLDLPDSFSASFDSSFSDSSSGDSGSGGDSGGGGDGGGGGGD